MAWVFGDNVNVVWMFCVLWRWFLFLCFVILVFVFDWIIFDDGFVVCVCLAKCWGAFGFVVLAVVDVVVELLVFAV